MPDERELRRAYTRLIRVYRPERAPEAFQRVRAAYEEARQQLAWRAWQQEDEHENENENEPRDEGQHEHEHEHEHEHTSKEDHAREPTPEPSRQPPEPPDSVWARYHATRDDDLMAAHGALISALAERPGLAAELHDALPEPELRLLAAHPALSWAQLASQPSEAAAGLMRLRIDTLLLHGQWQQALDEGTAADLLRATVAEPELEASVLKALLGAAWFAPQRVAALARQLEAATWDDWEIEVLHDRLDRLLPAATALPTGSLPTVLAQTLGAAAALDHQVLPELCQRAREAALRDTEGWLAGLGALHDADKSALPWLGGLLASSVEPVEEGPERTGRARAELDAMMRDQDKRLGGSSTGRVQNWLIGLLMLAVLMAIPRLGWWSVAAALGAFVVAMVVVTTLDTRLYAQLLRPALAYHALWHGEGREVFGAWIEANTKLTDDIGRFSSEIEEDPALDVLATIGRAGIGSNT